MKYKINHKHFFNNHNPKSTSFTLIELLVVVAIMGLLAVMGVVAFNHVQAKARDAKREADIETIKTAMELAMTTSREYPDTSSNIYCLETECDGVSEPSWCTDIRTYMPDIPSDPLYDSGRNYCYLFSSDGSDFRVTAVLEKNDSRMTSDGGIYSYFLESYSDFSAIPMLTWGDAWGGDMGWYDASPFFQFATEASDMDFGGEVRGTNGETLTVNYGDGNSVDYTLLGTGTDVDLSHTYSSVDNYIITLESGSDELTELNFGYYGNGNVAQRNLSGNIGVINELTNLTTLDLAITSISGDISDISNLTSLTYLSFYDNQEISGDISALSNLTSLIYLNTVAVSFSGDISALSGLTSLTSLTMNYVYSVSGDISALSGLTSLTSLQLVSTSVSGDISALSGLTSLTHLYLCGTSASGDISAIANIATLDVCYLYNSSISDYTSTTLPDFNSDNYFVLVVHDVGLTSTEVDNLLIDLDSALSSGGSGTLRMDGTNAARTSASDAAKTSLEGKGFTVTVNE